MSGEKFIEQKQRVVPQQRNEQPQQQLASGERGGVPASNFRQKFPRGRKTSSSTAATTGHHRQEQPTPKRNAPKLPGDKNPIVCKDCGNLFDNCRGGPLNHLFFRNHFRKHSGQKPFSCTKCSFASAQRSNVLTHIKSKHSSFKNRPESLLKTDLVMLQQEEEAIKRKYCSGSPVYNGSGSEDGTPARSFRSEEAALEEPPSTEGSVAIAVASCIGSFENPIAENVVQNDEPMIEEQNGSFTAEKKEMEGAEAILGENLSLLPSSTLPITAAAIQTCKEKPTTGAGEIKAPDFNNNELLSQITSVSAHSYPAEQQQTSLAKGSVLDHVKESCGDFMEEEEAVVENATVEKEFEEATIKGVIKENQRNQLLSSLTLPPQPIQSQIENDVTAAAQKEVPDINININNNNALAAELNSFFSEDDSAAYKCNWTVEKMDDFDYCGEIFCSKQLAREHARTDHDIGDPTFPIDKCYTPFP